MSQKQRTKNRVTKSHTVILARIIHTQIAFLPSIWYPPISLLPMSFLFILYFLCCLHCLVSLFCCFFSKFWCACITILSITSPAHFIPPASNYSTLPSSTQTSPTHQFVPKIVSAIRRGVFLVGGKGVLRAGRNKTASLLRLHTSKKMELSAQISGKSSDALCACAFEGCIITHQPAICCDLTSLKCQFTTWRTGIHFLCFLHSPPTWPPQIPTSYDSCLYFLYPICSLNSSLHWGTLPLSFCLSSSPMRFRRLHRYFPASCKCPLTPSLPCFSCFLDFRQQIWNPKYPCGVQELQFHSSGNPAHHIILASSALVRSSHLHWQNVLRTKAQAPTNQRHFLAHGFQVWVLKSQPIALVLVPE